MVTLSVFSNTYLAKLGKVGAILNHLLSPMLNTSVGAFLMLDAWIRSQKN
jgi:hypothetical protein